MERKGGRREGRKVSERRKGREWGKVSEGRTGRKEGWEERMERKEGREKSK
jgi:hypothetical protein